MALKAAVFDLDGVVVDTVPIHFKAWKQMFGEYGIEFTFDDYKRKVDGIPRMDGARAILTDIPQDELERAAELKQVYFLEHLGTDEIPTYHTTIRLIEDLQKAGIKVAIISSSRNCPRILRRIGLYEKVDTVICGLDITKGKPDPQIFLTAADHLGVGYDECVVFEDAELGVEAAKKGGMRCVGVERYGNPKRLALADLVVGDVGELDLAQLRSLFEKPQQT